MGLASVARSARSSGRRQPARGGRAACLRACHCAGSRPRHRHQPGTQRRREPSPGLTGIEFRTVASAVGPGALRRTDARGVTVERGDNDSGWRGLNVSNSWPRGSAGGRLSTRQRIVGRGAPAAGMKVVHLQNGDQPVPGLDDPAAAPVPQHGPSAARPGTSAPCSVPGAGLLPEPPPPDAPAAVPYGFLSRVVPFPALRQAAGSAGSTRLCGRRSLRAAPGRGHRLLRRSD